MMAAVSRTSYGISTIYLMHFLTFKWEGVVESLRLLNVADSMYLDRTAKRTEKVIIFSCSLGSLRMHE